VIKPDPKHPPNINGFVMICPVSSRVVGSERRRRRSRRQREPDAFDQVASRRIVPKSPAALPASAVSVSESVAVVEREAFVRCDWRLQSPLPYLNNAWQQRKTFRFVPKTLPVSRAVFSCVLAFVGISAANLLLHVDRANMGDLSSSFGAVATLLYAAPRARFNRPRNVIGGNLVGGCVGLLCSLAVADASQVWHNMFVPGAAVGATILINSLLDCTHPPSGAVALFAATPSFNKSAWYMLCPILLGDVVLLIVALLLNNVVKDDFFRTPPLKVKLDAPTS
jgi:hypothetical protein